MALETANWVTQLVDTNPTTSAPVSEGDDHLKMIKTVLSNSFPSTSTTAIMPNMYGQSGKVLSNDGTDSTWAAAGDPAGTAIAMAIALVG